MDIGPLSAPYLLAPVLAMAQLVNVSRPGEEPDPSQPIPEDMRLFDPALTDGNGEWLTSWILTCHFHSKRSATSSDTGSFFVLFPSPWSRT